MNQLKQINNLTKPQSFFKVYEAHFTLKLPTQIKILARTKLNSERFFKRYSSRTKYTPISTKLHSCAFSVFSVNFQTQKRVTKKNQHFNHCNFIILVVLPLIVKNY